MENITKESIRKWFGEVSEVELFDILNDSKKNCVEIYINKENEVTIKEQKDAILWFEWYRFGDEESIEEFESFQESLINVVKSL